MIKRIIIDFCFERKTVRSRCSTGVATTVITIPPVYTDNGVDRPLGFYNTVNVLLSSFADPIRSLARTHFIYE